MVQCSAPYDGSPSQALHTNGSSLHSEFMCQKQSLESHKYPGEIVEVRELDLLNSLPLLFAEAIKHRSLPTSFVLVIVI